MSICACSRFDPCSPGSCWATFRCTGAASHRQGFRSLFSWIMLGDRIIADFPGHTSRGFDPCSPGSCWATRCSPASERPAELFRSLFSWIMLGDTALRRPGNAEYGFRSLFSWIMLGDLTASCAGEGAAGFRSLFSWIMLGDVEQLVAGPGHRHVSILVLLDHAGRLSSSPSRYTGPRCFDPCSPGSCSATCYVRLV